MFGSDKRHYNRCSLLGSGMINEIIRFFIIDFSATGFRIYTEAPLEENEVVEITLKVRTNFEKRLQLKGKVKRCHRLDQRLYESGVEFVDVDEFVRIELDEVVNKSCGKLNQLCELDECSHHIRKTLNK